MKQARYIKDLFINRDPVYSFTRRLYWPWNNFNFIVNNTNRNQIVSRNLLFIARPRRENHQNNR